MRRDIIEQMLARSKGKLVLQDKPTGVDGMDSCPKCGYMASASNASPRGWRTVTYVSPDDATTYGIDGGECLMVTCTCCKFRWREEVLTEEGGGTN